MGVSKNTFLIEHSTSDCDIKAVTALFTAAKKLKYCPVINIKTPWIWRACLPSFPSFMQSVLFYFLSPADQDLIAKAHQAGADITMQD